MIFRELNLQEVKEFRDWAEKNDPPELAKWDLYHPVCRQVWEARGIKPHDAKQLAFDRAENLGLLTGFTPDDEERTK